MRPVESRRSVPIYVGFTIAFSSIFYFLIAKSGHSGGPFVNYVGCLMWCPGLAALATCKYLGRDLSTLGWNWGTGRYQLICYLIPLSYGTASYAFVWLTEYHKKTSYLAGEFGAALGVVSIFLAFYFWRRRDEVEGGKACVADALTP